MTSRRPWMPLYVADYLADTSHLTTLEHGAYLLLLMHYWRVGKLPANAEQLARVCRLQKDEFAAVKTTLGALFDTSGDSWKHLRVESELQKTAEISEKRSISGRKGQAALAASKKQQLPTHFTLHTSHTHKEERKTTSSSPLADESLAIPLSLERTDEAEALREFNNLAERIGLPTCQKFTKARRAKLQARLADCGGIEGWRAALAKVEAIPAMRGKANGNGHEGWRCNIDFLLTESKFTKLMEGHYDNWGKDGGGMDGFTQVASELAQRRAE